jgi:hypothetical protein
MDYLKMAIALIQEADEEKKRLEAMNREIAKIPPDTDYWTLRMDIESRYNPTPHKSVVNDNIKTARRLLARAYM